MTTVLSMPQDPLQIALEHHRGGRFRQAEVGYRAALEEDRRNAEAAHWLGVLLHQAGRSEEAVSLLEKAASGRPGDVAFQHNLAQAYVACGRSDDAIVAFERAAELDPTATQTLMGAATARLARKLPGDAEAAVTLLERARAAGLDSAELHYYTGVSLLAADRLEEAIAAFRAAIEKKPDFAQAYYHLGVAHGLQGHAQDARSFMNAALEIDPTYVRACQGLAVLEAECGRLQEAELLFRRAIELRPDSAAAHQGLGAVLQKIGRPAEATRAFMQAVRASRGQMTLPKTDAPASVAVTELERKLTPSKRGAELHFRLATTANVPLPPTVPPTAVTELFDRYAPRFDQHLQEKLGYQVPERLARAVADTRPSKPLDVLDLGCGTGLCGPLLRPMAGLLCGVDLSPAMIEKAKARGVYDRLETGELIDAMQRWPRSFDLLVAADVLIYVGDLAPVFEATSVCLRPGGLLAFSVEAGSGERYQLHPKTLRFTHSRPYIQRLTTIFGFREESFGEMTARVEANKPVPAYLFVLRLPGE